MVKLGKRKNKQRGEEGKKSIDTKWQFYNEESKPTNINRVQKCYSDRESRTSVDLKRLTGKVIERKTWNKAEIKIWGPISAKYNDRQRLVVAGRPNPIAGHRTLPTAKWLTIQRRNDMTIWKNKERGKTNKGAKREKINRYKMTILQRKSKTDQEKQGAKMLKWQRFTANYRLNIKD